MSERITEEKGDPRFFGSLLGLILNREEYLLVFDQFFESLFEVLRFVTGDLRSVAQRGAEMLVQQGEK